MVEVRHRRPINPETSRGWRPRRCRSSTSSPPPDAGGAPIPVADASAASASAPAAASSGESARRRPPFPATPSHPWRSESQHRRENSFVDIRTRLLDHAGRARGETPDDVAGRHLARSPPPRRASRRERRGIGRRRTPLERHLARAVARGTRTRREVFPETIAGRGDVREDGAATSGRSPRGAAPSAASRSATGRLRRASRLSLCGEREGELGDAG